MLHEVYRLHLKNYNILCALSWWCRPRLLRKPLWQPVCLFAERQQTRLGEFVFDHRLLSSSVNPEEAPLEFIKRRSDAMGNFVRHVRHTGMGEQKTAMRLRHNLISGLDAVAVTYWRGRQNTRSQYRRYAYGRSMLRGDRSVLARVGADASERRHQVEKPSEDTVTSLSDALSDNMTLW